MQKRTRQQLRQKKEEISEQKRRVSREVTSCLALRLPRKLQLGLSNAIIRSHFATGAGTSAIHYHVGNAVCVSAFNANKKASK